MKTLQFVILLLLSINPVLAQRDYPNPPQDLIPEKLTALPRLLEVVHFPQINDPIKIEDSYYWKHMTSILSKTQEVTIIEYGAYIYYNNAWNLRKSYPLRELDKTFGTKNRKLLQAQPYTWNNNWRVDNRLFGGWALWYFIGETSSGELVCGYQKIHTTSNLINP